MFCLNLVRAEGRAESALVLSFYVRSLRCKDSLLFPRKRWIVGYCGITLVILPIPEYGLFFFFFFFFSLKKIQFTRIVTIGTYWSVYKAERNTYKFTVYNYPNLPISMFRSMYKAERLNVYLATFKINTECDS